MNAKNVDIGELIQSLNSLDPENIGSWPLPVKVACYILAFCLVLLAGYILDLRSITNDIQAGQAQEQTLLQDFEQKAHDAQNIDYYKKQLSEMRENFGALLRQLPQDIEVPGLLEDITHTGLGSGLEFASINLESVSKSEFYVEQPIKVVVQGDYHSFGAFVSGIAALPRIVTLHDFTVTPIGGGDKKGRHKQESAVLQLEILAKTYQYNNENAEAAK